MNIKQAKVQIESTVISYLTKDRFNQYIIPTEKQRPLFIYGPPGIGKTAIIKQIAQDLNIGLVSYSMAHHTRQSALGLPFISKKKYGNQEYSISEYTMSEIITAVYDLMEETKTLEGILFLDEVNCISETLAPAMLQFLQYKIFGQHQLPIGWIVITAGNPPEYNKSVNEFDIATLDRIKKIVVESDFSAWIEYADRSKIHPSIINYLNSKRKNLYVYEKTARGAEFITPRGWEDLSEILKTYEINRLNVDFELVEQYLQKRSVAVEFCSFYELYAKYQNDIRIDKILSGEYEDNLIARIKSTSIDEKMLLVSLFFDQIATDIIGNAELKLVLDEIYKLIIVLKDKQNQSAQLHELILNEMSIKRNHFQLKTRACILKSEEKKEYFMYTEIIQELIQVFDPNSDNSTNFEKLKTDFSKRVALYNNINQLISDRLKKVFVFFVAAFGIGQEITVFLHKLTDNEYCSKWIFENGSEEYYQYSKDLRVPGKSDDVLRRIANLELQS